MDNTAPDAQRTVDLEQAITRGEQTITQVALRRPSAGELRGVSLFDLARMDTTAVATVLPRITSPILTSADVAGMDPADLMACAQEVAGFLLTKAQRAAAYQGE